MTHTDELVEAEIERGVLIDLEQIDEHPDNPSTHTEADIEILMASLRRFGQPRDLIVRRKGARYQILAGHGVRKAMLRLGQEQASCTIVPDSWTDVQAAGYLLVDNHRADQDDRRLLLLWEDQLEAGADLTSVGTDYAEIAAVRAMLDMDGAVEREKARPRAVTDSQQHKHIKLVLYMAQVDLVEAALRKTGRENRGEAMALICQAYLENDWLPPEDGEAGVG